MVKLSVKKVNGNDYELINDDVIYKFNIKFYDTKVLPKENDLIYMNENLLDKNYKEYSEHYQFGSLDSIYGRPVNDSDIICLIVNDTKIYYKRVYG